MKITKNTTVEFEYVLKDENGIVLDSTDDGSANYVHGYGIILPGLEAKFEGMEEGAEFQLTLPPEEGYGEASEAMIFEVERSLFPEDVKIEIGMQFESGDSGHLVRIKEIKEDKVIVDANHPMAGKTLNFDVKVLGVRKSTEEEINNILSMIAHSSCDCGCSSDSCGSSCSGCGPSC
ncbi:MAG: peptidylprolyl isomerase [Treponema sp.]|nr:MAG: peptidylprolyl isomerase [Treponema sp.]